MVERNRRIKRERERRRRHEREIRGTTENSRNGKERKPVWTWGVKKGGRKILNAMKFGS